MTSVNVSSVTNTVVVTDNGDSTVVEVITAGPQGPQGPPGFVVDTAAKVDKSVVYYDGASSSFKADAIWTTTNLTDGGNF
jgi:hypothetical protein